MKLTVIIPAYRRHPLTLRHFEYCLQSSRLPEEIIIINDGGDPGLKEMLQTMTWDRQKTKVIYAEVEEDILWNYNGACNLGVWISTGDIIALEDTDHIPKIDTYEVGMKAFENNPEVGRLSFGRTIVQVDDCMKNPREAWVSTGGLGTNQMVAMMRRETYLKLKGQDERLCGSYGYMAYDFPWRRDRILKVVSKKVHSYWAVFGDQGEPGLQRGLSVRNRGIYHENVNAGKLHSKHGILNFQYNFEVL